MEGSKFRLQLRIVERLTVRRVWVVYKRTLIDFSVVLSSAMKKVLASRCTETSRSSPLDVILSCTPKFQRNRQRSSVVAQNQDNILPSTTSTKPTGDSAMTGYREKGCCNRDRNALACVVIGAGFTERQEPWSMRKDDRFS